MSTIQTPKEIKEEGIILKSYYKVLLLCFTFALIVSPVYVEGRGIKLFSFNESLWTNNIYTGNINVSAETCSANQCSQYNGTTFNCINQTGGSSFIYSEHFDQYLNKSSPTMFGYNAAAELPDFERYYTKFNVDGLEAGIETSYHGNYSGWEEKYYSTIRYDNIRILQEDSDGLDIESIFNSLGFVLYENDVQTAKFSKIEIQANYLNGTGKAMLCVDNTGKIYRGNSTGCP